MRNRFLDYFAWKLTKYEILKAVIYCRVNSCFKDVTIRVTIFRRVKKIIDVKETSSSFRAMKYLYMLFTRTVDQNQFLEILLLLKGRNICLLFAKKNWRLRLVQLPRYLL